MSKIKQIHSELHSSVSLKYILGNESLVDLLLTAWLARGHVLIEGPPGTGKTLAAKVLAHLLSRSFKRVQFTSDMLPSDIIGSHIYQPSNHEFKFFAGPLFADCILADEINRTPPRTQSALLEAMEERQVTVEGQNFALSRDFFVVATQNPQDFEGTFPLPEAQTDRFLFKVVLKHASVDVDQMIIRGNLDGTLPPQFSELPSLKYERSDLDQEINSIRVDDSVLKYIARILNLTRSHALLSSGTSVRGGVGLARSARIHAILAGRDFVTPDDVKTLVLPVLRHRIQLTPEAQISGETTENILGEILKKAEFPT